MSWDRALQPISQISEFRFYFWISSLEVNGRGRSKRTYIRASQVRNKIAAGALQKLLKQKPAPLTTKSNLSLIEAGNFEDDLEKLKDVDWIIEVIVEKLEVKKALYEKIDAVRKPGTIISSNTSGISIEAMAEGRSEDFQKHFLGTHFFNPPRYLKLLEVIPASTTAPEVVEFMNKFGEDRIRKRCRHCKRYTELHRKSHRYIWLADNTS